MWSRMLRRTMSGMKEKEDIHTATEGMMVGMIDIGVRGVGGDTETVTDFRVGQEGPATIKPEAQDIHKQ